MRDFFNGLLVKGGLFEIGVVTCKQDRAGSAKPHSLAVILRCIHIKSNGEPMSTEYQEIENMLVDQISLEELRRAFVHPLKTLYGYYLYDVNTNMLISIDEEIYKFFASNCEMPISHDAIQKLTILRNSGFLKLNPIKRIEHTSMSILSYYLENKVQGVTLQVTQQCNLRCKYCVYSGDYYNREHKDIAMSRETALKAIDFLFSHSSALDEVDISFYGGEPLLRFELIRELVKYIERVGEGKKINYGMTTNGTVFTDPNLSFLEEYKFNILISLDGPKNIHNANRVFKSNGQGTFDAVMQNLHYIKKNFGKLYETITFNAVLDPALDMACVNNFFVSCDDIEFSRVSSSVIADDGRKQELVYPESFFIQTRKEEFLCFMHKLGRIDFKKITPLILAHFNQLKTTGYLLRDRTIQLPAVMHPSGPCIPGARKLFVNVKGQFFPCERVNESAEYGMIGNVDQGFDVKQIERLYNIGQITEDECKRCWALRLCLQCYSLADDGTKLSKEMRLSNCENCLANAYKTLQDYCALTELGFQFDNDDFIINGNGESNDN